MGYLILKFEILRWMHSFMPTFSSESIIGKAMVKVNKSISQRVNIVISALDLLLLSDISRSCKDTLPFSPLTLQSRTFPAPIEFTKKYKIKATPKIPFLLISFLHLIPERIDIFKWWPEENRNKLRFVNCLMFAFNIKILRFLPHLYLISKSWVFSHASDSLHRKNSFEVLN